MSRPMRVLVSMTVIVAAYYAIVWVFYVLIVSVGWLASR